VYYSGHGVMSDGHTFAVCPDYMKDDRSLNSVVDMDILIGQLASIPDTFVVALLDCCRLKVAFPKKNLPLGKINIRTKIIEDEHKDMIKCEKNRQIPDYFGGECVRIYSTSSGTADIERCENIVKGSKITNKFFKTRHNLRISRISSWI